MELIIGIVVIWVIITVIKALKTADNLPSMDESGNMRCKGCGSSSFKHTQIMTALTPMNAIIAASGGQDTNVISSQKKPHDRFSLSCGFSYSISGAGHIASALYTKTTLEVWFEVRWVKML